MPRRCDGCRRLLPTPSATPDPVGTASHQRARERDAGSSDATSPIDGVLTAHRLEGLTQVTAFTLRTNDGQEITFKIGTLENGDQFPPGHLAEHLATSSPVRVYFRAEGPDLVVYRLEDAPPS